MSQNSCCGIISTFLFQNAMLYGKGIQFAQDRVSADNRDSPRLKQHTARSSH